MRTLTQDRRRGGEKIDRGERAKGEGVERLPKGLAGGGLKEEKRKSKRGGS